jgi:hypothetical protein
LQLKAIRREDNPQQLSIKILVIDDQNASLASPET